MNDPRFRLERNKAIYEAVESGATMKKIAAEHGISAARARQIHCDYQRKIRSGRI